MKTEEDEAFDDLARKQGMWGGGFTAKRRMAADRFKDGIEWWMDTKTYGAYPNPPQWHIDTGNLVRLVPAQPAQEPVAEVVWGAKTDFEWKFKMLVELACVEDVPVKLYAGEFKGAAVYWHDTEADKVTTPPLPVQPVQEPDALTIAYQSGYYDGKKAALAGREWNFCERCGKRTADLTVIHTCTPPQEGA